MDNPKSIQLDMSTTAYDTVKFIEPVMGILNKDNCRIHHPCFVLDAIIERVYKSLFMQNAGPVKKKI